MATAAQNRKTMEGAFEAFNRHDLEAVRQTAADDFVEHEVPEELGTGFDATRRNIEMFIEAFPDITWDVLDIVTDERAGAARLRVTGTHRGPFTGIEPTGNRIDVEAADYLRFDDDGQVTDHWGYQDKLEFLRQLDAVPADMAMA